MVLALLKASYQLEALLDSLNDRIMNSFTTTLLILTVLLVVLPTETYAFGAGDIPDFAYLNGKRSR